MTYSTQEREHDTNLVARLKSAKIEEHDNGADIVITLAHLRGTVTFVDGVMYWQAYGAHGEKRVDQSDIDGSANYLRNYGRKAVRNNLERIAEETIVSAQRRLA